MQSCSSLLRTEGAREEANQPSPAVLKISPLLPCMWDRHRIVCVPVCFKEEGYICDKGTRKVASPKTPVSSLGLETSAIWTRSVKQQGNKIIILGQGNSSFTSCIHSCFTCLQIPAQVCCCLKRPMRFRASRPSLIFRRSSAPASHRLL